MTLWGQTPTTAQEFLTRGNAYFDKRDYDSAIADYTQVIRLAPNDVDFYYYNRGNAYYTKKDYDRAIADYTQAMRLNPNNADFYFRRGNAYVGKENYDRAVEDYEKALKIDPNHVSAKIVLLYVKSREKMRKLFDPESDFETRIIRGSNAITNYVGSKQTVNIPPTIQKMPVTSIWSFAFEYCTDITSVIIPNSVTRIGRYAFNNCTSLASVIIPNNVTSIEQHIFNGCTSLTSVTFQGMIASSGIDEYAFNIIGDLKDKYLAGGIGTYKTTAPVSDRSVWTKQ